MIRFARYFCSFIVFTLWYGAKILSSALLGVRQKTGGVYDASARAWGRAMLRGTGITVRVEGARLDPTVPKVYIANHASFVDIWAILAEFPGTVRFVYKKEMDWIPVMGLCMKAMRHIPIDRRNRARAFAMYDVAAGYVRGGTSAVVFAEGTRSRDGRLLPLKKGPFVLAIAAQAPVVPVFCEHTFALMPRGSFRPKPGVMTLRIGADIPTVGLGYGDRDGLATAARQALLGMGAVEGERGAVSGER